MEKTNKGWGSEIILDSNDDYCMKILQFDKKDAQTSMVFHKKKIKTWTVLSGSFKIIVLNMKNLQIDDIELTERSVLRVLNMIPHRVVALEDGSSMIECSTYDDEEDYFRIDPGDTQKREYALQDQFKDMDDLELSLEDKIVS